MLRRKDFFILHSCWGGSPGVSYPHFANGEAEPKDDPSSCQVAESQHKLKESSDRSTALKPNADHKNPKLCFPWGLGKTCEQSMQFNIFK